MMMADISVPRAASRMELPEMSKGPPVAVLIKPPRPPPELV